MAASKTKKKHRFGHVALVGRPNVGKSTLMNALLGERIAIVSHHPQTTRDRLLGVVTTPSAQIAFLDTPGLHAARNKLGTFMNHEAEDAMAGADVVVFVTDVGRSPSGELGPDDRAILAKIPEGKPTLFVLNKIDRAQDKAALIPYLEAAQASHEFAAYVPISTRSKDGVSRVLAEIEALLPPGERHYDEDMLTDRPARYLVAELVREQVLALTREELPHGVAVQVEGWADPSGRSKKTEIEVAIHVPKESHKKIVVGRGGAMLKEIGTRARARAEKLTGRPIVLKLWVRVTEGWTESDEHLRDLGYHHEEGDER